MRLSVPAMLALAGVIAAVFAMVMVVVVRYRQNRSDRALAVKAVFTARHPGTRHWAVIAAEPVGGTVLVTQDTGAEAVIEPLEVSEPFTARQRPFRGRNARFIFRWRPGYRGNLDGKELEDVKVQPMQRSRAKRRGSEGRSAPPGTDAAFGPDVDLDL